MSIFSSTRKAAAAVLGVAVGLMLGVSSVSARSITPPTLSVESLPYNGAFQNAPILTGDGYALSGNTSARNKGEYTVTATLENADDEWEDDGTNTPLQLVWEITPVNVNEVVVSFPDAPFTYTGSPITPTFTVKLGGVTLPISDYSVESWSDNTNAGTASVSINTSANLTGGPRSVDFAIQKKTPEASDLTPNSFSAVAYNGNAQAVATPGVVSGKSGLGTVTVKYNGSTTAPTNAGTYAITVAIEEGSNFTAASEISLGNYKINQAQVTSELLDYEIPTDVKYTGDPQGIVGPTAKNTVDGLGTDITVWYGDSKTEPTDADTYRITVDIDEGTNYLAATKLYIGDYTIGKADGTEPSSWPTTSGITYSATTTLSDVSLSGGDVSKGSFAWTNGGVTPTVTNSGYGVTFTPADVDNYDWTGVTLTNTVALTVSPALVAKPTVSGSLTYTGSAQSPIIATDDAYTISDNSQTDANTYRATVGLKDKNNYAWNNGSNVADGTTDLSLEWSIGKATPEASHFASFTPTAADYTGGAHTVTVGAKEGLTGMGEITVKYFKDDVEVTDGIKNAGGYTVKVAVDASGTNFNASTTDIVVGTYTINKIAPTKELLSFDLTAKTYDKDNAQGITVTAKDAVVGLGIITVKYDGNETEPTDAGEYVVTVDIAEGLNYTAASGLKIGDYKINQATPDDITFPTSDTKLTYGAKLSTASLTGGSTGGTFDWSDGNIIPTVNNRGYEVTFTPTDTKNYDWSGVTKTGTVSVTVNPALVTKPTVSGSLTYTGNAQSPTIATSDAYEITGDVEATNAGDEYAATVALKDKDNYRWDDGTGNAGGTGDLSLEWTIEKATPSDGNLTFDDASVDYDGEVHTVTVKAVSPMEGLGTPTVKYFDKDNNPVSDGPKNAGDYTVQVQFAEGSNFKATTSAITLTETFTINPATLTAEDLVFDLTAKTYAEDADLGITTPTLKDGKTGIGTVTVKYYDKGNADVAESALKAGTYTVKVDVTAGDNFALINGLELGSYVINKGTIEFSSHDPISTTYTSGLTLQDLTSELETGYSWKVPATELNAGDNQSFDATYTDPEGNYEDASGKITVNVAKALVTKPTVTSSDYNYEGIEHTATITGDTKYEITGDKATNAGTYTATVALVNTSNYSWDDGDGNDDGTADLKLTWKILKGTPSDACVTFTPADADYNGEEHTVAVALVDGDLTGLGEVTTVKYDGEEDAPVNAGDYTVTVDIAEGDNFEAITALSLGTFTIKQAKPEVTEWPTAATIDYGKTLSESALSGGAANVAGTFAWTNPSFEAKTAGEQSYGVKFTPTKEEGDNYEWTGFAPTQNVAITVNPATTIIPEFSSFTFEATYGDKLNSVTLPTAIDAGNTDGYTPGSYSWVGADANTTVGDVGNQTHTLKFTPTDNNYESKSAEVSVTVSPKSLSGATVAVAAGTYTYNGSAQEPTVTVTLAGSVLASSNYSVGYEDNTNAGTATVTVTGTGNYKESANETFSIGKATLTLTAKDVEIVKGDAAPDEFEYTVSGLKGTDDESVITTKPTLTLDGGFDTNTEDDYDIEISDADAGNNYTIEYVAGKLTVLAEKKNVNSKITFNAGNKDYTGLEQTYEIATISDDVIGKNGKWTYDYTEVTGTLGSNGKPKSAGTYTVTATYTSKIEEGTTTAVFTINKVDLTVTVSPAITKSYDGDATIALDSYTLGFSGFVNSETAEVDASGVTATFASANVGDGSAQAITFSGAFAFASTPSPTADLKNYNIVATGITGTITKAAGTWVAPSALNTTYSTGKTLADVTPPTNYAWVNETTEVGNASATAKSFAATYTQPGGNHEAVSGSISVNVAKASGLTTTSAPSVDIQSNETTAQTIDLTEVIGSKLKFDDHGTLSFTMGTVTNTNNVLKSDPTLDGVELTYQGNEKTTGSAEVIFTVGSENYQDVEIHLYFYGVPVQYNITVSDDGHGTATAKVGGSAVTKAIEGASVTLTAEASTGYEFDEWEVVSGDVTISSNTFTMPASAVTVKAKFKLKTYTITWSVDGGSAVTEPSSVNHGSSIVAPTAPTKADKLFGGWYAESGLDTKVTFPVTNVTENKTFYAKWVDVYTVTFSLNYDGAASLPTATTNAEGKVTFPATPTRSGYTFAGWYDAATGGSVVPTTQVFTQNTTVYAQWTQGTIYQITFDATGGTVSPAVGTTGLDGKLTSLPSATRSGYTFNGWFTSSSGGTQVTANTTFGANATLYAQWTAVVVAPPTPSYTAYTVTFNPVGGTVDPTSGATGADTKLASLPTPTRAGYAFDGWFTSSTGGTEVTRNTTFSANTTVYAHWSAVVVTPSTPYTPSVTPPVVVTPPAVTPPVIVTPPVVTPPIVSVTESDREVPGALVVEDAAVAPLAPLSVRFAAGPSPALRGGAVSFFSSRAVKGGALRIFDASGSAVADIAVKPGVGEIGVWNLKDGRGVSAAAGSYAVKGILVGRDGTREKVSFIFSVAR